MKELLDTIKEITAPGKGILAADESTPTCTKRFEGVGVESTEDTRRDYREMLFSAPGVGDYIAGVILFEETLKQKTRNGVAMPEYLKSLGIIPGIKVDKGLEVLPGTDQELVTRGLDFLGDRLKEYKVLGARFAKWRAVYRITDTLPSCHARDTQNDVLARYAAICQENGIVPIVEPEVLIDGDHSIERCSTVTEKVLRSLFAALSRHKVLLEGMILKPSMAISGKGASNRADVKTVAAETMKIFKRTVPAAVPTVNFLSGGQTPQEATAHLNELNQMNPPWNMSFSYARALQEPALAAWKGKDENVKAAQEAFLKRCKLNSLASLGKFSVDME